MGTASPAEQAAERIMNARSPADLFAGRSAKRTYRQLAQLVHPDAPGAPAIAGAAFACLSSLWHRYERGGDTAAACGDIANLYATDGGMAKIPRDPRDNDLMEREARTLAHLHREGEERLRPFVPTLVDTQRQRDPHTGAVRRVSVLERLDGFVTLAQIHAAYPAGIDGRDAAWMWRRLLTAAGFAHRAGVVHAAIIPEHVMIHPRDHGLILVDWCYAVTGGDGPVPAIVTRYRDWYPPEMLDRRVPGPDADMYMAARCMMYVMGGRACDHLLSFACGCMLPQPGARPHDAHEVLGEFDDLIERLWGPRTFRPFSMPQHAGT